jgi:hypothetical protein
MRWDLGVMKLGTCRARIRGMGWRVLVGKRDADFGSFMRGSWRRAAFTMLQQPRDWVRYCLLYTAVPSTGLPWASVPFTVPVIVLRSAATLVRTVSTALPPLL